jgi:hypothetical protein
VLKAERFAALRRGFEGGIGEAQGEETSMILLAFSRLFQQPICQKFCKVAVKDRTLEVQEDGGRPGDGRMTMPHDARGYDTLAN